MEVPEGINQKTDGQDAREADSTETEKVSMLIIQQHDAQCQVMPKARTFVQTICLCTYLRC